MYFNDIYIYIYIYTNIFPIFPDLVAVENLGVHGLTSLQHLVYCHNNAIRKYASGTRLYSNDSKKHHT